MKKNIWAEPRNVDRLEDCYFYHTMEIPGLGRVEGEWDLRGREAAYLGNVDLRGKRVLELGTASGHLCFAMERMGAEVTAYDLSDEQEWDIVPYAALDVAAHVAERKHHLRWLNNGYWLAHKAFGSHAKVVYGTVYDIPAEIGQFDVGTFGSILLHVRDPFLALQRVAAHVEETMIVTDVTPGGASKEILSTSRLMSFAPSAERCEPTETWWHLPPGLIAEFLRILGFPEIEISFHKGSFQGGKEIDLFTVVGRRGEARCSSAPATDKKPFQPAERSVLDEMALARIPLTHVASHLLRRGTVGVAKRLLGRQ